HRLHVRRDAEEVAVVPERPVVNDVVVDHFPEAVDDDDPERNEEEAAEQDDCREKRRVGRGRGTEPAAPGFGLGGGVHSCLGGSTMASSAAHHSATGRSGSGSVIASSPWSATITGTGEASQATATRTRVP